MQGPWGQGDAGKQKKKGGEKGGWTEGREEGEERGEREEKKREGEGGGEARQSKEIFQQAPPGFSSTWPLRL